MSTLIPEISAQSVASSFVKQYYVILNKCPENCFKFYQESSLLSWPGIDGVDAPVTTLTGINDKIVASDFVNCSSEFITVDAQVSLNGGVIVAVTGILTAKNNVKKNFNQTFFLAEQENGFYVLNDILRFVDVKTAVNDDEIIDPATPIQNSDRSASSHTKEVIENGNVKEESNLSVSKDSLLEVSNITSSDATLDKVHSALAADSNVKKEAPKITYASMVAKMSPVTFSNAVNQEAATRTAKASNGASKVSTPSSTIAKPSAPASKVVPKVQPGATGSTNNSTSGEGRGIYIGGLPSDISKQGVLEVLKKFGPVRRNEDGIQMKRHEDGFCCGFAEFESVDSARRAVEAHHVQFGEKEAYITYKRSSANRGNNDTRRPPSNGGFRNSYFRGRENGEVANENRPGANNKDQTRTPRRSIDADRWV